MSIDGTAGKVYAGDVEGAVADLAKHARAARGGAK